MKLVPNVISKEDRDQEKSQKRKISTSSGINASRPKRLRKVREPPKLPEEAIELSDTEVKDKKLKQIKLKNLKKVIIGYPGVSEGV